MSTVPRSRPAQAVSGRSEMPIVVGVDGSCAALNGVRWAVAEAAYRGAPLRLVHAVGASEQHSGSAGKLGDNSGVDSALVSADAEVTSAGQTVRFESARIEGIASDAAVVSVVLDDDPDNDSVVHLAMEEGRLRDATVRQVDRRLTSWVRRFPDVHVELVSAGRGRSCLESHQDRRHIGLAVVGQADADRITELKFPNCHPIVGYPDCSVLLVRH